MKSVLSIAAALTPALAYEMANLNGIVPDINSLTTIQYNTMLAGVVWGVTTRADLTELVLCVEDAKVIMTELYTAV